jgi:hypothetical protein
MRRSQKNTILVSTTGRERERSGAHSAPRQLQAAKTADDDRTAASTIRAEILFVHCPKRRSTA